MQPAPREPIFNVPGVVVALALVLFAVHAGRQLLLPTAADDTLVDMLAFNPVRYGGGDMVADAPAWAAPLGFVSHALLHGDVTHLVVNTVWLLAVGSPIAWRMSALAFLGFFALCAAGGALLFLIVHPGLNTALVGASGAISGFMAAAFRLMFAAEDESAQRILRERPVDAARLSVWSMLARPLPRNAVLGWVGVNIVVALALGSFGEGMPIAWEAHLGGFFAGLLTFELFDRGWPGETPRAGAWE